MEALAERLKADREAREGKREKQKKELRALRVGCATAFERINTLEKQIRHYILNKSQTRDSRVRIKKPEDVAFDAKRERMAAELESRKNYVQENCQNL